MNKEYIEREVAIKITNDLKDNCDSRFYDEALLDVWSELMALPAADVKPIETAYWDWQVDGTHFCSYCGTDALWFQANEDEYVERCSIYCPHCGRFMTHIEDQI